MDSKDGADPTNLKHELAKASTTAKSVPHAIAPKNWYDKNPTMDFSTLLIAKPLPFNFKLNVRRRVRAENVNAEWMKQKLDGEFEEARVFWKDERGRASHEGDAQLGWGKIYS